MWCFRFETELKGSKSTIVVRNFSSLGLILSFTKIAYGVTIVMCWSIVTCRINFESFNSMDDNVSSRCFVVVVIIDLLQLIVHWATEFTDHIKKHKTIKHIYSENITVETPIK